MPKVGSGTCGKEKDVRMRPVGALLTDLRMAPVEALPAAFENVNDDGWTITSSLENSGG